MIHESTISFRLEIAGGSFPSFIYPPEVEWYIAMGYAIGPMVFPTSRVPDSETLTRNFGILYWVGVAVFIANDFAWIAIGSGIALWYADVFFRLVLLLVIIILFRVSRTSVSSALSFLFIVRDDSRRSSGKERGGLALWIVGATVCGVIVDQTVWPFLGYRLPFTQLFMFPQMSGTLRIIDITFAIALVAVTEEIFFRSLALRVFSAILKRNRRSIGDGSSDRVPEVSRQAFVLLVVVSSLVFGLGHWANGLHAIISTAIWGVVPMIALVRTGSLWPALVTHYVTNFVAFSAIVPESYYRLFVP